MLSKRCLQHILHRNFSQNAAKILSSGVQDMVIPKIRIEDHLFENIAKWEHRTATECALTGRKYTYKDLHIKSNNLNKCFRKKLNLKKGDVVAIILPNVPEFPIAVLGIFRAGLVATTINPSYTPHEINKQLEDSSAKAIITLTDLYGLAKGSVDLSNKKLPIITINATNKQTSTQGSINFSELCETNIDLDDLKDLNNDQLAILPYSSGTTGLPKGVMLTHSNILANLKQMEHDVIKLHLDTTQEHQDTTVNILPMFHIYGFTICTMMQLCHGIKIVTLPRFTPEHYVGSLRKHKPNYLYVAPPIALFLANHPSVTSNELENIRTLVSGAAPLGASDEEKLISKAHKEINMLQGYGLTETSPAVCFTRISDRKDIPWGSVGKPVPNTLVKIVEVDDPSGTHVGPNVKGELLVKGPQVMSGYLNKEEETKKTFIDGWLRTGDMAYYTDKGYVFITDRLKELIKVKGFQVAPAELENIIREIKEVADAAVIGIPSDKDGEVPRAYIVEQQGKKVDINFVRKYVEERVASFKKLSGGIEIVESIPKNAAGKTLRRQLKIMYDENIRK